MKPYMWALAAGAYATLLLMVGVLGGSWLTVLIVSAATGLCFLAGLLLGSERQTERVVILPHASGFDEHAAQVIDLASRERIEGDELGRRLTKALHVEADSYPFNDKRDAPW